MWHQQHHASCDKSVQAFPPAFRTASNKSWAWRPGNKATKEVHIGRRLPAFPHKDIVPAKSATCLFHNNLNQDSSLIVMNFGLQYRLLSSHMAVQSHVGVSRESPWQDTHKQPTSDFKPRKRLARETINNRVGALLSMARPVTGTMNNLLSPLQQ